MNIVIILLYCYNNNSNITLLKVLNVLNFILLFTYFLQPERTDCGVVLDITSAHYRLSE